MNVMAKVKDTLSRPSELEARTAAVEDARGEVNSLKRERRQEVQAVREARARRNLEAERKALRRLDDLDPRLAEAEEELEAAEEALSAFVREEAGPEALERLMEAEEAYRDALEPFGRAVAERFAEALEARANYRAARDAIRELEDHDPSLRRARKAVGQDAEAAEVLGLVAFRAIRPVAVDDEPLGQLWAEAGLAVRDGSFVRGSPLSGAETHRIIDAGELPI